MSLQDKNSIARWEKFRESMIRDTPAPVGETAKEKAARIAALEADPEAWFAYYFKKFYTAAPAKFQKQATRRIMKHYKRWYEVRAWSRELAKSTRTMMEICKLALTGKIRNVLLISHSYDNAAELLMPYLIAFESNPRILNDYGVQKGFRSWEIGKFITDVGTIPANPDPKSYISDEFMKRVAADPKLRAFATEFDKK